MTHANDPTGTPTQPPLAELLAGYLQRQAAAHADGLAPADSGEVVPFEAAPVQPVDPQLAWAEATAALRHLYAGPTPKALSVPPDWSGLVTAHEPAAAIAFAVGNFPQLVRDLHPLMHAGDLAPLRPAEARAVPTPGLLDWVDQAAKKKQFPQLVLAVGALRLARQFDRAAELLRLDVPAEWRAAWANEQAALAWHRGRADEAAALWQAQAASVPVHFNRGLAALFFDRPADARTSLGKAVAALPEDGGWHHLASLYVALAEMRG